MLHRSRHFQALGHSFGIQGDDRELIDYLDWAYADLAAPGEPAGWYSVRSDPSGAGLRSVTWANEPVASGVTPAMATVWIGWEANRRAAASAPRPAFHAGALVTPVGAVLVVGQSGAGKSTVVAHLLQSGWGYLTDECIAFDPSGRPLPYPKPLALSRTSLEILGLEPERSLRWQGQGTEKLLVPAHFLTSETPAVSSTPRVVCFIERGGIELDIAPLSAAGGVAEALTHLHTGSCTRQDLERSAALLGTSSFVRVRADSSQAIAQALLDMLER